MRLSFSDSEKILTLPPIKRFVMKLQSKQEFELYALMYVAALDMKTSKEELKLLAKEADDEMFQQVADQFAHDNDFERVQTLMQGGSDYLNTSEQREALMGKLRKIAESDSLVHIETAALSMLERLLMP